MAYGSVQEWFSQQPPWKTLNPVRPSTPKEDEEADPPTPQTKAAPCCASHTGVDGSRHGHGGPRQEFVLQEVVFPLWLGTLQPAAALGGAAQDESSPPPDLLHKLHASSAKSKETRKKSS